MNFVDEKLLPKINEAALLNVYMYLIDRCQPIEGQTLMECIDDLERVYVMRKEEWKDEEKRQMQIMLSAINRNTYLAETTIRDIIYSPKGLTAGSFIHPDGNVTIVYRGTGTGEWVDNGEGLSGVAETNTYITYDSYGNELKRSLIRDHATAQQAQALNWFNMICAKNHWIENTHITVSGHSKGGNKSQFVTIHSDLVDECYTFHAQGFAPEAIRSFKKQYGEKFKPRQAKIMSFASENDCVHSLGHKLCLWNRIYYFKSKTGIHDIDGILDEHGKLNRMCEQGKLAETVSNLSNELMELNPIIRKHGTVGAMNIFQRYVSKDTPINGNEISMQRTIAGMILATGIMMHRLKSKYGNNEQ